MPEIRGAPPGTVRAQPYSSNLTEKDGPDISTRAMVWVGENYPGLETAWKNEVSAGTEVPAPELDPRMQHLLMHMQCQSLQQSRY